MSQIIIHNYQGLRNCNCSLLELLAGRMESQPRGVSGKTGTLEPRVIALSIVLLNRRDEVQIVEEQLEMDM